MRILIIDDTEGDHDIAVECLEEAGGDYQVYHAFNAKEGLEFYRNTPVDCILMDYHMPGMDGLEALKQLTEENKIVPVIMMTGEGDESVAVAAMKLGAQDYIPKKILTSSALKRAVERAVERTGIIRQMEGYRLELERSNCDLEQFSNIVAHDLKAPLRAVTQHLMLIRNKHKNTLDEKSLRSMEFAVEGATRMRLLIEALFEYAHLGFSEPHFDSVDMAALLEQTKRDLATVIEETGANITHDALPSVMGDGVLLAQLLQNLIANAIKYCKETPHIHVNAQAEADRWRIGVQDNGIGIAPENQKKIFAIFRRLHQGDEYPGIGLGLAICDRIVKQHGGNISVHSQAGNGSLFSFTLPSLESLSQHQQKRIYA